jgi:hypothetical protein
VVPTIELQIARKNPINPKQRITTMFKKTLIATAAAAVLAAGSLAAMTSTASATYNYGIKAGHYVTKVVLLPKKVCEPFYKKISWQDYYGDWHWKTVYAGEKCKTIYVKDYQKVFVPYVIYNNHGLKFSYGY